MKALLLLLAVTTLAMVGCVAGPYTAAYSYNNSYPLGNQPYYPGNCDLSQVTVVGPQYYRAYDNNYNNCNTQYRNYSDAPVIVNRPGGNIVVPRSWN